MQPPTFLYSQIVGVPNNLSICPFFITHRAIKIQVIPYVRNIFEGKKGYSNQVNGLDCAIFSPSLTK